MDWASMMPLFAPLTEQQVRNLAAYQEKRLDRDMGRPPKEAGDKNARYQQRLQAALQNLVPEFTNARQRVFDLLEKEILRSGHLTRRWLLIEVLYPTPLIPYLDRLYDWHKENLLLFDEQGEPEPQSTAAILILRELVHRKRFLPPPPPEPQSFYVWRQNAPGAEPTSYELPLVKIAEEEGETNYAMRPVPEAEEKTSLLWTPWKGIVWNDQAWLLTDGGAIRWLGEPTAEQLANWLHPLQLAGIIGDNTSPATLAKQALPILAAGRL